MYTAPRHFNPIASSLKRYSLQPIVRTLHQYAYQPKMSDALTAVASLVPANEAITGGERGTLIN